MLSLKLTGLAQVLSAFQRSPTIATTHLEGSVARSTTAVRDRARGLAPRRTGRLANAIEARVKGLRGRVEVGVPYAPHVEFGTVHVGARPFMRPAAEGQEAAFVEDAKRVGPGLEQDFGR